MHACACVRMVKNDQKHSKRSKTFFIGFLCKPYMSLLCAWWKRYFFTHFQVFWSFSTMQTHAQACFCWSKYTTFVYLFRSFTNFSQPRLIWLDQYSSQCSHLERCQPFKYQTSPVIRSLLYFVFLIRLDFSHGSLFATANFLIYERFLFLNSVIQTFGMNANSI